MILTPVDRIEIDKFYKKTKVQAILQEFANGEYDAVRIDDHGYKTQRSRPQLLTQAQNALRCLASRRSPEKAMFI